MTSEGRCALIGMNFDVERQQSESDMKKTLGTITAAIFGGMVALGAYLCFVPNQADQVAEVRIVERNTPVQFAKLPVRTDGTVSDFTYAAEQTLNAVVHIKTEVMQSQMQGMNPWFDMFHPQLPERSVQSTGSGVIISQDGYIVTNNHVIERAEKIEITLNDNRTFMAEVIGADPAFDLALIKVEEEALPFIPFGSSDDVRIGEWVLAVGNPFNLTSTVTAGIVSAKGRNINLLDYDPNREIFPVESFIQTDAAVNPGNSGGALVNTRGELVGINTAIASRTGSYSGYSFAVPSSIVEKVTHDLLEFGNVQRAYIGVSISDLNQDLADRLGIDDVSGVYVRGTTPGGAAEEVGISEGDIITAVDGKTVHSVPELQERISQYRPGDDVMVSVKRNNKLLNYDVIVTDRYGSTDLKSAPSLARAERMGAIFEEVSRDDLNRLDIPAGVRLKKDADGRFKRAGIREGFIITRIDKHKVVEPEMVADMLDSMEGGVLIEGVYPNGTVAYYGFGI